MGEPTYIQSKNTSTITESYLMVYPILKTNHTQVLRFVERKKKQIVQRRKLFFRDLADYVLQQIELSFEQTRSPINGSVWAALKSGERRKPLTKTGVLRNSFDVVRLNKEGFTIQSSAKYATFHQFGTKNIPVRQFVSIDQNGRYIINKDLQKEINRLLQRHFGKFDKLD